MWVQAPIGPVTRPHLPQPRDPRGTAPGHGRQEKHPRPAQGWMAGLAMKFPRFDRPTGRVRSFSTTTGPVLFIIPSLLLWTFRINLPLASKRRRHSSLLHVHLPALTCPDCCPHCGCLPKARAMQQQRRHPHNLPSWKAPLLLGCSRSPCLEHRVRESSATMRPR